MTTRTKVFFVSVIVCTIGTLYLMFFTPFFFWVIRTDNSLKFVDKDDVELAFSVLKRSDEGEYTYNLNHRLMDKENSGYFLTAIQLDHDNGLICVIKSPKQTKLRIKILYSSFCAEFSLWRSVFCQKDGVCGDPISLSDERENDHVRRRVKPLAKECIEYFFEHYGEPEVTDKQNPEADKIITF